MTYEKLNKAKVLQNHINGLITFKNELSVARPIGTGKVLTTLNGKDIEVLKKALKGRIAELEKEFEEL